MSGETFQNCGVMALACVIAHALNPANKETCPRRIRTRLVCRPIDSPFQYERRKRKIFLDGSNKKMRL